MANLTDDQVQTLLVRTVGDVDPATGDPTTASTGIVASNIELLWQWHAAQATVSPRLQWLYVQRHALDLILGVLRPLVDFQEGRVFNLQRSQQVRAAEKQREVAEAELRTLERRVSSAHSAVGALTKVAPISPPTTADVLPPLRGPDANSPAYGGSPYVRERWGDGWGQR